MAQIDHSIYFQQETPDIVGGIARGMKMSDMIKDRQLAEQERAKQQAIKDAYTAGMVQGPDGTVSFDQNKTMSALAKGGHGVEAFKAQQQFDKYNAAKQDRNFDQKYREIDMTSRLLGSVKDQETYSNALQKAQRMGIDVGQMPKAYDSNFVDSLRFRALTAKEQMEHKIKQRELKQKDRELGIDAFKAKAEAASDMGKASSDFQEKKQKDMAKSYVESQQAAMKSAPLIDQIDDAIKSQLDYSQNSITGTGPFATGFGISRYFSEDTKQLDQKFKNINLENMVKKFAGMSRAIDSEADRRAWEGTQANIENDDEVNMSILLGQKSMAMKAQAEAAAQREYVRQNGKLDEYYESPVIGKITTVMAPNGKMVLIPKENLEAAKKQGFMGIDEFAQKSVSMGGRRLKGSENKQRTLSLQQQAQRELERRRRERMRAQNRGGGDNGS